MTDTLVTIVPPPDKRPSVLQLPGGQVFANADGSFTIAASYCAALLRDGWQLATARTQ